MATVPRKQTVFVFFVSAIVVASAFVYVYGLPGFGQISYANTAKVAQNNAVKPIANPPAADSGWQKQFLNNGNSNAFKAPSNRQPTANDRQPLTATDLLGRNFFEKYAELRQAGLTTDTAAVGNASSDVISQSLAGVGEPKTYSLKDISVIADNDAATRAYAENLMNILKSWLPATNEAEIAMNAFDKSDMSILAQIDPIIAGYRSALNKLLGTPVTQDLAQDQVDLLNGISMQLWNAEALRKADSDPVSALAAINLEVKSLETVSTAIGDFQNYFARAGISFVPPASGSILQSLPNGQ